LPSFSLEKATDPEGLPWKEVERKVVKRLRSGDFFEVCEPPIVDELTCKKPKRGQ